jgi:hypothetical protein
VESGPVLAYPFLSSPKAEVVPKSEKRHVMIADGEWGGVNAWTKSASYSFNLYELILLVDADRKLTRQYWIGANS